MESSWLNDAKKVNKVLKKAPVIDKNLQVPLEEYQRRKKAVYEALKANGIDVGFVYSNEHYCGDVPYLGGCTNIQVEPVAGLIGKNGFHILAGPEGGYVAEQLAYRSGAKVHKLEMLKFVDEDYAVEAERLEDVMEEAADGRPKVIGLLTPRAILPLAVYERLVEYVGDPGCIVDAQQHYQKIKHEKSDIEMRLVEQSALIGDVMLEAMLAVIKPGMLETQVSQWGYAAAQELGVEQFGFDIMVTANTANRTLIGKALNQPIHEGDMIHVGVAPKYDGLTSCERCSVACVKSPDRMTEHQKFWMNFIEGAFKAGLDAYKKVAAEDLPAKLQEQAVVEYFKAHEQEASKIIGREIRLELQKPYTCTHDGGYTECQEFYGAITLETEEPLAHQIVTMLDVAIRGTGNTWDDVVIPGLDFIIVEKTLGKYGKDVKVLNRLPVSVQHLVGY